MTFSILLHFRDKLSSYYNELMITNEELMTSFKIRHENYNEVQKLLTDINQTLYHAQRLRGNIKGCLFCF